MRSCSRTGAATRLEHSDDRSHRRAGRATRREPPGTLEVDADPRRDGHRAAVRPLPHLGADRDRCRGGHSSSRRGVRRRTDHSRGARGARQSAPGTSAPTIGSAKPTAASSVVERADRKPPERPGRSTGGSTRPSIPIRRAGRLPSGAVSSLQPGRKYLRRTRRGRGRSRLGHGWGLVHRPRTEASTLTSSWLALRRCRPALPAVASDRAEGGLSGTYVERKPDGTRGVANSTFLRP